MKIIKVEKFKNDQFYDIPCKKKQIVLHHTVSGVGVDGDIQTWLSNAVRIATAYVIHTNGDIYKCFEDDRWAHHLGITGAVFAKNGMKTDDNVILNKASIGIEIDSAGGLIQKNGEWYASYGQKIPLEQVTLYPKGFRGFYGFQKYTSLQISALKELIEDISKRFSIEKKYNANMWDVTLDALKGNNGIFTHVSYRYDKSDCHPQPELIEMLKSL